MTYFIINIVNGIVLILFSILVDVKVSERYNKQMVSLTLLAALISFLYAVCIVLGFFVNKQLTQIFATIILFCSALFSVRFAGLCFQFPAKKLRFYHRFLGIVFLALAIYILFYKIDEMSIKASNGFLIESQGTGIGELLWSDAYRFIYLIIVPLFGLLTMFLRIDSIKSKIHRQQMFVFIVAFVAAICCYKIINIAATIIDPMFNTLLPVLLSLFILILYKAINISLLFDFKSIMRSILKVSYTYIFPAIAVGIILSILYPLRQTNSTLFIMLFIGSIVIVLFCTYYVIKFLRRKVRSHEKDYATSFEEELETLDYSLGTKELSEQLVKILQENVDISDVDILIELEENELSTVFSTQGKQTKLSVNNQIFDVILNADHPVVFKSHIETHHVLAGAKRELEKIFEQTYADAMIVLREGRKVLGVIFLGSKKLGNVYTDYDYRVFMNLYSYFFVVGYYMKNIANESVVGTVNRELQFSGQIIQSIQENIDTIQNPKVDIGYISKSAHTLGGEFVDFIRLTNERYIMVIGDLSGKGINASMSMVILKSITRTFLAETRDFKILVQKVNEFIRFNLPKGTFFAGVFMLMDFTDNTFYYINCGIPALFMYNQAYNNVIEIQGEGRVLGFVKSVDKLLHVKKIKLNPGDMILACTDGLIDSVSLRGEPFGKARVQQSILENLAYPADKMSQFLLTSLLEFTSKEQEDDVTVVAIKCLSK